MRQIYFTLLAVVLLTQAVLAKPTRETPPAKAEAQEKALPPQLAKDSNWGKLTQSGTAIQISGHEIWEAIGEIRKDGKVQLVWTLIADGSVCLGVYDVVGEELIGLWQHGDRCYIAKDGTLTHNEEDGYLYSDRVFRVKPPEPGFN